MGIHKRRRIRLLSLVAALAMLAAACGSDSGSDAAEGTGSDDEVSTESTSFDEVAQEEQERTGDDEADEAVEADSETMSGEVTPGGILVMTSTSDRDNLDPITSSSFVTQYRVANVYQRLLTFETGPDIGYTSRVIKGELAEDWDISDDGLTYTFNLRQGVLWHDVAPVNGREFTSADVKATYETILAEGHQAGLLQNVISVDAPDDYTIVLTLSEQFSPLLNNLANHFMWVMPVEAFEEGFDRTQNVIGTGPFMLGDREFDVETNYVRNPDYWDVDENGVQLPYLDGLTVQIVKDTNSAIAAFKAGEVNILTNAMAPEVRDQLMQDVPDGQFMQWIDAGMGQVGINMDREPLNDLRVRQAISLAIDRTNMGATIDAGGTVPTNIAPALADFTLPESERNELLPYDPEQAMELLAEAGYPDGLELNMIASDVYGQRYVDKAEWLVEDLRAIGIEVDLEVLDYATYFGSRWPDVEYDIQFGPQTPFLEPDEWLRLQMHSGGSRNWYNIDIPELDAMIDEQLSLDGDERVAKIQEIQRYALTEVMNPIPVWTVMAEWTYSADVTDFYRHGSYGMQGLERVWLNQN